MKDKSKRRNDGAARRREKREKAATQNALARSRAAKAADIKPGAYKLEEARHYLGGISVPTIHRAIQRGLLRPNRSLRHLLFPVAELDRFLREGMTDNGD